MTVDISGLAGLTINELHASLYLSTAPGDGLAISGGSYTVTPIANIGLALFDNGSLTLGQPSANEITAVNLFSVPAGEQPTDSAAGLVVGYTETLGSGETLPASGEQYAVVVAWNSDSVLLDQLSNGWIPGQAAAAGYESNTGYFVISNEDLSLYDGTANAFPQNGSLTLGSTAAFPTIENFPIIMPCFAKGSRILARGGEVAVETLRPGDSVWSVLHASWQEVVWVGRREVDCAAHPHPEKVWPIRVRAGAFGSATPARDLWLSPDHAVYVTAVLIPVKYLVNGKTITQVKQDRIDYCHVEIAQHGILLAEGLTVESYLDMDDRSNFINNDGALTLHPVFNVVDTIADRWAMLGCAPLVVTGPELEAAKARLTEVTTGQFAPAEHRVASISKVA
jgi:hypothetical protein